jgi:hypothetical protein
MHYNFYTPDFVGKENFAGTTIHPKNGMKALIIATKKNSGDWQWCYGNDVDITKKASA